MKYKDGKLLTGDSQSAYESEEAKQATEARAAATALKMSGVEFEGVMCSATSKDMWGLSAIKEYIDMGHNVHFEFENGSKLTITPDNRAAFTTIWTPFRAQFFGE